MTFLIKTGFWMALILFFLPIDREEAGIVDSPGTFETLAAVRTVVTDVRGFCERNPATCTTGAQTADVLRQKAVYSAGVVQTWLSNDGTQPTHGDQALTVATTRAVTTVPADEVAALIQAADARIPERDYPPL